MKQKKDQVSQDAKPEGDKPAESKPDESEAPKEDDKATGIIYQSILSFILKFYSCFIIGSVISQKCSQKYYE